MQFIAELKQPEGQALVLLGLQKEELSGEEVLQVAKLAVRYPAPSRVDLFALVLAKARGGAECEQRLKKWKGWISAGNTACRRHW